MSTGNYRVVDNILYINLEGHITANNAATVENEILLIRKENPTSGLVLDADKLEYISSAGLRIILRLVKQEKNMIDAIRIRNGNLNIVCGKVNFDAEGL